MARSKTIHKHTSGDSLLMAIILLAAIGVLLEIIFDFSWTSQRVTSKRENDQTAIQLGEAGIEKAVWCLNNPTNTAQCPNNPSYTGETFPFGTGSVTVSVTGTGNTRTINATGTVGLGGSSSKDLSVTLIASDTGAAFQYGVQSGIGGIELGNNAFIQGNIFSSGSVTGTNGSYVTGDAVLTASNPTPDAVSNPSVSPLQTVSFASASGTTYLAQSFTASTTNRVFSLDVKLAQHNTPTSTITAYIYDDNAGAPGTNLSGSGQLLSVSFPADNLSGWENGWTTQNFTPSTTLVTGSTYWLVLKASTTNNTKYWLSAQGVDGTYSTGTAKSGSALTSLTPACAGGCDIAFRINLGGITPTLTIPTIGGNVYSHTINNTTITKKAYYMDVGSNVKANGGSETCADTSTGPNCFGNQPDQAPQNFPISEAQITQMEAQAAVGGTTICSPTCVIPIGSTIGPRKYIGNVILNGNGTVTMTGSLWIVGNLTIDNDTALKLADGYGTTSGTVIADDPSDRANKGKIILSNNGDLVNNSTPGSYIMAVSMNADPTFTETAIDVSNNLAAGILFAPFGKISLSNNASLREVTGQKLVINNNASVIYSSGLANVIFSSGPGGSWVYQKGSYVIQ